MESEWISVNEGLPKVFGWYEVKTKHGFDVKVPFVRNGAGKLVWVVPDPTTITHWRETTIQIKPLP